MPQNDHAELAHALADDLIALCRASVGQSTGLIEQVHDLRARLEGACLVLARTVGCPGAVKVWLFDDTSSDAVRWKCINRKHDCDEGKTAACWRLLFGLHPDRELPDVG